MLRICAFLTLFLIVACSTHSNKNEMILDYKDFGPQVIASEIIGVDWWQSQSHGGSRPIEYNVKVVVYRNAELNEIKEKYPTVPEEERDYRYLEYDLALNYLEEKINEDVLEGVTVTLKKTRQKIISQLGGKL